MRGGIGGVCVGSGSAVDVAGQLVIEEPAVEMPLSAGVGGSLRLSVEGRSGCSVSGEVCRS